MIGDTVTWEAKGPYGAREREGVVRAFIPAGEPAPDLENFRAQRINLVHDRYLVEIERAHGRTGLKMASLWMAPKAATVNE